MRLEMKGNYFYQDGQPFFWLGDTAWLLFEKLSFNEAKEYLENRKALGFTVIQAVLLQTYKDGYSCKGKSPHDLAYWEEVCQIISYAKSLNLVMGILPAWGSMVKNKILTLDNINQYIQFLLKKFKNFDNII